MRILKTKTELLDQLSQLEGKKIGFVPTMGALHEGHLSLIRNSKKEDDITICSIFVNPAQFDNSGDLQQYPKTLEKDIMLLKQEHCDLVFVPTVAEMYDGQSLDGLKAVYDFGYLETILEGKYRKGHYKGVGLVIDRFLRWIQPSNLYLGQKDYQQCLVISRLISDNSWPIQVQICPIVRESSGLALSSRNQRLSEKEKKEAARIAEAIFSFQDPITASNVEQQINKAKGTLNIIDNGKLDYLEIRNADTLRPIEDYNIEPKVALVAMTIGEIRLIDNFLFS